MHELGAALRDVMEDMGPAHVKLAQFLATRGDVPIEVAEELERARVRALPPFEEVADLLLEIPGNVRSVRSAPIAASALNVTYLGTWVGDDGAVRTVDIKVPRPGVRNELWAFFFKHWLGPDVARQFGRDLDFVGEARRMGLLADGFLGLSEWNVVPRVLAASPTLLVTEHAQGIPLSKAAEHGYHGPAVADALLEAFLHQFMLCDTFHGNAECVRISSSGRPAFVWNDGGAIVETAVDADAWRDKLVALAAAMFRSDVAGSVAVLETMGVLDKADAVTRLVRAFMRALVAKSSDAVLARIMASIDADPAWRADLRVAFCSCDPSYFLFGKSIVSLNAICIALDPTFNIVSRAAPYVGRMWHSRSTHNRDQAAVFNGIMELTR